MYTHFLLMFDINMRYSNQKLYLILIPHQLIISIFVFRRMVQAQKEFLLLIFMQKSYDRRPDKQQKDVFCINCCFGAVMIAEQNSFCLITFGIWKYQEILFRMGNEACNTLNGLNLNIPKATNTQIRCPISEKQSNKTEPFENFQAIDEEMDEYSPYTKFNIRCLKISENAFVTERIPIKPAQDNDFLFLKLLPKSEIQVKESLQEWSMSKNLRESNKKKQVQKRESKMDAIQSYAKFVTALSPQIFMRILGESFYKIRTEDINPFYLMIKKIGEGSFGSVYKGKCLKTGQLRAIKVLKKKIMNEKDEKSLLSQINILKKMDHINIIKLYDVFFHKNFFYVVTEYCEGGNLLEALHRQQIKSQKDVIMLVKQIISAVSYMHKMKIAHRDLKLDNIVLVKEMNKNNQRSYIKIIDFGLAQQTEPTSKTKTGIVGTVSYMAPEIFSGYYSCMSDVWSCGIIICMLLIGYNPFKRKRQNQTIFAIQSQDITFKEKQWFKISSKAKSLIIQMLNKSMDKRMPIDKVLNNIWLRSTAQKEVEEKGSCRTETVISNFNSYHRGNNFICYVKNFLISRQLSQATRQELALIFQSIDTDSSGVIEKQELIQLYSLVSGVSNDQIEDLIKKIDQNQSGRIDFHEFLLCMTNNEIVRNKSCMNQAFDFFDEDRTGFVEKKELFDCLEGCEEEEIVRILKEADFNGDGKISREEFINYLTKFAL